MDGSKLPAGIVTFLFTDIEGSTALFHELGDDYPGVLAQHHVVVRSAIEAHRGVEIKTEGDAFFVAFADAADALAACLDVQRGLAAHDWSHGRPVKVRMGMHTGPVQIVDNDYVGLSVHEAARVAGVAHGGQVLLSEATRLAAGDPLPAALGTHDLGRHQLKDFPEPRPLYQLVHVDLAFAFPPPRTQTARAHNLPVPATPIIGRAEDLAVVQRLVVSEARLVTITGPGGLGKTRLSIESARSVLNWFSGGVWFADLSAVTNATDVAAAIVSALGLRDEPGQTPMATVSRGLAGTSLLVLDNLEQLGDNVVVIAELLAATPGLTILGTSRQRLRLRGEHEVSIDGLASVDATALFVSRAEAANSRFAISVNSEPTVAQICQSLDGIPLAIELAAARIREYSVAQVLAQLTNALDVLDEGDHDLPARQRTLRSTIAWSYDLLGLESRAALRTMGAFRGGAGLDALAAVHGRDTTDVAQDLVDRSLAVIDGTDAEPRIRLLETIRQFAAERLERDVEGESTDRHRAHIEWFRSLARHADTGVIGSEQAVWLERVDLDHDNFRLALATADPTVALEVAADLGRFWTYRGHWHEGRELLAAALDHAPEVPSPARARALLAAGYLAVRQGDKAADVLIEDARNAALAAGDVATEATAENVAGERARLAGDPQAALKHYDVALNLATACGDERLTAMVQNNRGIAALALHDNDTARAAWESAVALAERVGDTGGVMRGSSNLGLVAQMDGDLALARSHFGVALRLGEERGDRQAMAAASNNLGRVAAAAGQTNEARNELQAAALIFEEIGDADGLAVNLLNQFPVRTSDQEGMSLLRRAAALFRQLGNEQQAQAIDEERREMEAE